MLKFPTMAERVVAEFRAATTTTSLVTVAKRHGADVEDNWPGVRTYRFDDDTSITVTGRGRNHKVETHLP